MVSKSNVKARLCDTVVRAPLAARPFLGLCHGLATSLVMNHSQYSYSGVRSGGLACATAGVVRGGEPFVFVCSGQERTRNKTLQYPSATGHEQIPAKGSVMEAWEQVTRTLRIWMRRDV
jgi:hypothetical protein